jgi:glutamate formiminotransferase / formiminotetrahydrofolate cyclodeaminase
MRKIVECVPNISNGRDPEVYNTVAHVVDEVPGCKLLDIDPGYDTNRTVITFAGEPAAVLEAAFRVVKRAGELIDMRHQTGTHPRHGATDVCPFVPISGLTLEDCVEFARQTGQRIGEELGIPVWLYEYAASKPEWKNLAIVRKGEYEALPSKLGKPEWQPDFGPNAWNDKIARTGVCTVGARKCLVAYNINFNTRNVEVVNDIALEIRESGRTGRDSRGKFLTDEEGDPVQQPGIFKFCKAMGWYIDDFNCAQLTMNLTDWETTAPHIVFDKVQELARERGLLVTGSELVGLIPLGALRAAGQYFLDKQRIYGHPVSCSGVSEAELIRVAVKSLGLDELKPFDAQKAVIEYAVDETARPLANLTVAGFVDELASLSPAPGGGSVAALAGALAAGLGAMVPALTVGKKGYRNKPKLMAEMNALAAEAQQLKDSFLRALDDDTAAFNELFACFGMPKDTEEQQAVRASAIQEKTKLCIEVPLSVLQQAPRALAICLVMAERGNQNSLSDAGVGGMMALACAQGTYYNVLINLGSITDADYAKRTRADADAAITQARELAAQVQAVVTGKLAG